DWARTDTDATRAAPRKRRRGRGIGGGALADEGEAAGRREVLAGDADEVEPGGEVLAVNPQRDRGAGGGGAVEEDRYAPAGQVVHLGPDGLRLGHGERHRGATGGGVGGRRREGEAVGSGRLGRDAGRLEVRLEDEEPVVLVGRDHRAA